MTRSASEIQEWIIEHLSRATGIAPQELNPREPIQRFGLDSVAVVALVTDLEEWLGYHFRSNPLDDHATIEEFAAFLAQETAKGAEQTGDA